ncbi:MAG: hypothetical protein AB7S68_17290 [Polyangiaceae bacterium]
MNVILSNRGRGALVFVLAHERYCRALGRCGCAVPDERSGRRIPRSLTVPTGTRSTPLPETILMLDDVDRAIRRGALGVERVTAVEPERASPPPEPVPNTREKKKRGSR